MASTLVGAISAGLTRDALKIAGGALLGGFVAHGWITPSQETLLIGALISIIPTIVSVYSNWKKATAQAVVTAVEAHPEISVVPASKSETGKPIVTVKRPDYPTPSLV